MNRGEQAARAADEATSTPATCRRSRRCSRLVRALLCGVVVAVLLWGADWGARLAAQSLLARSIQSATGTASTPVVHLHGLFFLPQVIASRYDDVEVALQDLTSGPVRVATLHADLIRVHLPLSDVLTHTPSPVSIDRSRAQATLTYPDLNRYLAATGRPISVIAAPAGRVELTGTVHLLGRPVSASVRARLLARGNSVVVEPTQVDTHTPLDTASRLLLAHGLAVTIPLGTLPFGQQLTSVAAGPTGLLVRARGQPVVLHR